MRLGEREGGGRRELDEGDKERLEYFVRGESERREELWRGGEGERRAVGCLLRGDDPRGAGE